MVSLASQIENYLKRLLDLSEDNSIEIQRSDLAEIFMCVPSQINYVLETRFNPDLGYRIETRRGGGGYIKIMKLDFAGDEKLAQLLNESKAKPMSRAAGENLIQRLFAEDLLTAREAVLLKGMMNDSLYGAAAETDLIRGKIIRMMLITLLRDDLD